MVIASCPLKYRFRSCPLGSQANRVSGPSVTETCTVVQALGVVLFAGSSAMKNVLLSLPLLCVLPPCYLSFRLSSLQSLRPDNTQWITSLYELCPTYFGKAQVLRYKAIEHLNKARVSRPSANPTAIGECVWISKFHVKVQACTYFCVLHTLFVRCIHIQIVNRSRSYTTFSRRTFCRPASAIGPSENKSGPRPLR